MRRCIGHRVEAGFEFAQLTQSVYWGFYVITLKRTTAAVSRCLFESFMDSSFVLSGIVALLSPQGNVLFL